MKKSHPKPLQRQTRSAIRVGPTESHVNAHPPLLRPSFAPAALLDLPGLLGTKSREPRPAPAEARPDLRLTQPAGGVDARLPGAGRAGALSAYSASSQQPPRAAR